MHPPAFHKRGNKHRDLKDLLRIGKGVRIDDTAVINVEDGYVGDRSFIGPHVRIEGRFIRIGVEAWINEYSQIGGGSCFDPGSLLEVGDFLHMGKFSFLNQGRGLRIGHEFGCGIGTRVFTHGAYESAWDGFPIQWGPVSVGDRVWLPNALVNPNVAIGSDVVVASVSVVTTDLPSGCMAGGVPCRVLKENAFPRKLSSEEKQALFDRIFSESVSIFMAKNPEVAKVARFKAVDEDTYIVDGTVFDLCKRTIEGYASPFTEILKNQLRRNGIRFRFWNSEGVYRKW